VAEFELVGTDRLMTNPDGIADLTDGRVDLQALSAAGNRLIITPALDEDLFNDVVRAFPETLYVRLDSIGAEPDVAYLLFDDHESSYLAGAAAALKTTTGTIGFVGASMRGHLALQAGFGWRTSDQPEHRHPHDVPLGAA
jgi:basic membrane protein A